MDTFDHIDATYSHYSTVRLKRKANSDLMGSRQAFNHWAKGIQVAASVVKPIKILVRKSQPET